MKQILLDLIVLFIKLTWITLKALYKLISWNQEKPVRGEIVLITGAGHGIGKELALQYASHGATVVCWDINETLNQETVKKIENLGYPKAYGYVCDVSNCDQVHRCAKRVIREVGDVSILVNNAGIVYAHTLLEHTKEEIERLININLMSHFWILQEFLPIMQKNNHGHIVAISSCSGLIGYKYLSSYTASKFAVRGLMESLHSELRENPKSKIKITICYPYFVDTGLCKNPVIGYSIFKMMKADYVARTVMSLQRREVFESTIPTYIYYPIKILKLLPRKAIDLYMDGLNIYLDSDLNIRNQEDPVENH